jgi:hypothetical protein
MSTIDNIYYHWAFHEYGVTDIIFGHFSFLIEKKLYKNLSAFLLHLKLQWHAYHLIFTFCKICRIIIVENHVDQKKLYL